MPWIKGELEAMSQFAHDIAEFYDELEKFTVSPNHTMVSFDAFLENARKKRKQAMLKDRLNKLQRRVDLFPLLRYIHDKKIAELTAELVAMRLGG
jgi:hypothetical protein